MPITFAQSSEPIRHGRAAKPVPQDVLDAVNLALSGNGTFASQVPVTDTEGEAFRRDFRRYMRQHVEEYDKKTCVLRPVMSGKDKGKVKVLIEVTKAA